MKSKINFMLGELMSSNDLHEFGDATARIKEGKKGYFAQCGCGWKSREHLEQKEAVISFEEHVLADSRHEVEDVDLPPRTEPQSEKNVVNHASLLLAFLGFLYIISPIDLVPDYLIGVGWIEDIILGIFCVLFAKGGWRGKSPTEIISEIF